MFCLASLNGKAIVRSDIVRMGCLIRHQVFGAYRRYSRAQRAMRPEDNLQMLIRVLSLFLCSLIKQP